MVPSHIWERGFLRASANGHAFKHADRTPCFLTGDTWWAAGTHRFPWNRHLPTEQMSLVMGAYRTPEGRGQLCGI